MSGKAKREIQRRRARQWDVRLRVLRAIAASRAAREASRMGGAA